MNKPKRTPLAVQARHAQNLKDGMEVIISDDDGNDHHGRCDGDPWLLGGHTYVVNCHGGCRRFTAYSVMRVRIA